MQRLHPHLTKEDCSHQVYEREGILPIGFTPSNVKIPMIFNHIWTRSTHIFDIYEFVQQDGIHSTLSVNSSRLTIDEIPTIYTVSCHHPFRIRRLCLNIRGFNHFPAHLIGFFVEQNGIDIAVEKAIKKCLT